MSYCRRRKLKKETNQYDLLIEQQRLFHYENILIAKIEKIREKYELKVSNSKTVGYIAYVLPFLGFTEDSYLTRIFKSLPYYKEIFIGILILVYLIPSIIILRRTLNLKRFINLEDIYYANNYSTQDSIFKKFILNKIKFNEEFKSRVENVNISYDDKLQHYFKDDNKDEITFCKSELEFFIFYYFYNLDKNISGEISRCLSEIIISRYVIESKINKTDIKEKYKFIIDRNNILIFRMR